jgi:hypothetical protein
MHPKFPASSNCLRVPFIFVPHGAPKPVEWMAAHPGWVSFSATFHPRPMPRSSDVHNLETLFLDTRPQESQMPVIAQRPDRQRGAAPLPKRRPLRPTVFGPIAAETQGRHLGMRLSTPEGRAALLAETRQIRAYLGGFREHPGHRATVVHPRSPVSHPDAVANAEFVRATTENRQSLIELVASGDLKCEGFGGGCQNGGSFGMSGAYRVTGHILCASCAEKALGFTDLPGGERAEALRPYSLSPD